MAIIPESVRIKLDRARLHIADLEAQIDAVFYRDAYRFTLNREPDSGHHVLKVHDLPAINPMWSPIVGDAIHNLRTALDHLAAELVRSNGFTPGRNSKFRIKDAPFMADGVRALPDISPGISRSAREALDRIQPYTRDNDVTLAIRTPPEAHVSPLWIVHNLDLTDKHQTLLVARAVLDLGDTWWGHSGQEPSPVMVKANFDPLKNGDPVAWFDLHGKEVDSDFDPHATVSVCLDEPPRHRLRLQKATDTLDWLRFWTCFVVDEVVAAM